jgi:acetolactate synthase-1/2/3 large subunit
VLETLQELTAGRDDVIWTTGVGQHQMWAMQYLLCDRPRSFITSGGLGTMGYGSRPRSARRRPAGRDRRLRRRRRLLPDDEPGAGDRGARGPADRDVIVNNGYLGMVNQWQTMFFEERRSHVHLTHAVPDYAALAEAYGAAGFTVSDEASSRTRSPRRSPAAARRSSTPASTRTSSASR